MNISLINPRLKEWSQNIWVPLGLTYIAAVLEKEGHKIKIIDMNAEKINYKELQRRIRGSDVIGITGMITEYQKVVRIISLVRKALSDVKIILGGPLATTLPRELLEYTSADFIVLGEGERTVLTLVNAIEKSLDASNVDGIAYKKNGHVVFTKPAKSIDNLDLIPFPARHLLDMKRYIKNHFKSFGLEIENYGDIRSTNLISSRGCPYNCVFCFKDMWGHKWRARSPENIVEEMELLKDKYNINGFIFTDDIFVLDKKRIFKFTRILKERKLDFVWYCNGRVDLMQKDLLKAMYNAGCKGIAYGIESGNQAILNLMRKNITLDQVRRSVRWAKEVGMKITGYFMIGMLDETRETIYDTFNLAKELDLDFYGFSMVTPLPGTELYREAKRRGLIQEDLTSLKEWSFNLNVNLTKNCSDEELLTFKNRAFREFFLEKVFGKYYFLNPSFVKETFKVVLSLRDSAEAKNFIKSISEIIKSYFSYKKK